MAGLSFSTEKFYGFPLKDASVSFGRITAENARAYLLLNNSVLVSANLNYLTVQISLPGVQVGAVPFERPTATTLGTQTFVYQGDQYIVSDVEKSATYTLGSGIHYFNYVLSGIRTNQPLLGVK